MAQDNLGIAGSNHAPLNTLLNNPSSIVDSRAYVDVNLLGVSAYAHNNFIYLPKEDFNFLAFAGTPEAAPSYALDASRSSYYALADVNVQGPAVSFSAGKMAFALNTGVRSVTDVRGVGQEIINFGLYGFDYEEQLDQDYELKNTRINSLNWAEFGVSGAGIISQNTDRDLWTMGVSLKRLIGVVGASVRIDDWNYRVTDTSLVSSALIGEYGFNFPAWNSGRGWAMDIGFTYKKTLDDIEDYTPFSPRQNCTTCDYHYKIAFSLLDLGRIGFDPPFYANEFNIADVNEWEDFGNVSAGTPEDLDAEIENGMGLLPENEKASFNMWLPAALTAQFDYNFGNNIYANSTIIMGIPWLNTKAPTRGSQWSLTPRYARKHWEVSVPFVLHEWKYPTMGAAVRLHSVIIGTDNLGTYFFNQDVYGADIYVSLKYTLFRSFKCPKYTDPDGRPNRKKSGVIPCWN